MVGGVKCMNMNMNIYEYGGRPLVLEIFGQTDPVRAKKPIFNRYLLVVTQP